MMRTALMPNETKQVPTADGQVRGETYYVVKYTGAHERTLTRSRQGNALLEFPVGLTRRAGNREEGGVCVCV